MFFAIEKLTIEGFKSICKLEDFELRPINVLIGANGAGKSNFVDFFSLLERMVHRKLQVTVRQAGGADRLLHMGPGVTKRLVVKIQLGAGPGYDFSLVPTVDGGFVFERESVNPDQSGMVFNLGSGHNEALLPGVCTGDAPRLAPRLAGLDWKVPIELVRSLLGIIPFHFHFMDTGPTAAVRRPGQINDDESLRPDASNLAAFLYRISKTDPATYSRIRDVVRLAAPFFDDFKLRPIPGNENMIQLEWLQKDSDFPFLASQLSDGTLRFICLATALLQPLPFSTVLIDEPELGLHPYALSLLASLIKQAAKRYTGVLSGQVIVSTQSAPLLSEFEPEDVIAVEREQGQSTFRRLKSEELSEWLQEYSLGELWQKNVLGGRPRNEEAPASPENHVDPSAVRR